MNPWRKRSNEPQKGDDSISLEDIAWRIGASDVRPAHLEEEEEAAAVAAAAAAVAHLEAAKAEEAAAAAAAREVARKAAEDAAARRAAFDAAAAMAAAANAAGAEGDAGSLKRASLPWMGDEPDHAPVPRAAPPLPPAAPVPVSVAPPVAAAVVAAAAPAVATSAVAAPTTRRVLRRPGARPEPRGDGGPRKLRLWRDASALLFLVVAAVLIFQLGFNNHNGQVADASFTPGPTSAPTNVAVLPGGSASPTPLVTIGPVIDPSLLPSIEASPSPTAGPVITAPPATPRPTTRPKATPKPTVKPPPTPPPAPVAKFTTSCSAAGSFTVTFNASTSIGATTWTWDFDKTEGGASGKNVSHLFSAAGTYNVTLTVAGPGGPADSTFHAITVPCP